MLSPESAVRVLRFTWAGFLALSGLGFFSLANYLQYLALTGAAFYFGAWEKELLPGYLGPAGLACFAGAAAVAFVLCCIGFTRTLSLLTPGHGLYE